MTAGSGARSASSRARAEIALVSREEARYSASFQSRMYDIAVNPPHEPTPISTTTIRRTVLQRGEHLRSINGNDTKKLKSAAGISIVATNSLSPVKYRRSSNKLRKYHSGRGVCGNVGSAGASS